MTGAPYPGPAPTWSPPPTWAPTMSAQGPDPRAADRLALSEISTAALLSVVGAALGFAVPLILSATGYFSTVIPSAGSAITYSVTGLWVVLGAGIAGLVLSMVAFWFYRRGFLAIRPVDTRFSSSPTWALLAIVGLAIVALALVLILAALVALLNCAGTSVTTIPPACINIGALLGGLGFLFLGAIILLIGYIGLLVAIWRLGDRYGDSLFKVGAVLLIIPYLSFVGEILILYAARQARGRVEQQPMYGMPPPGLGWQPPPPR